MSIKEISELPYVRVQIVRFCLNRNGVIIVVMRGVILRTSLKTYTRLISGLIREMTTELNRYLSLV